MNDNTVGMAGQFIAAVLETAGVYAQDQVLTGFSQMFIAGGALLFLVAIIGGLSSVAIYGNYRKGMYMLIAPVLFWGILNDRVPISHTKHVVGARESDAQIQMDILKTAGDPARIASDAKVTRFFVIYDNLVSSLVQGLVSFLLDTEHKADLIAVARERMYDQVLNKQGDDTGYLRLLGLGLMGSCAQEVSLQQEIAGLRDAQDGTPEKDQLQKKTDRYDQLKVQPRYIDRSLESYIKTLNSNYKSEEAVTCADIWELIRLASVREAKRLLDPANADTEEWRKDFVELQPADWQKVYQDVQSKIQSPGASAADIDQAANVLGAFYFRNSALRTPFSALSTQLAGHGSWDVDLSQKLFGNVGTAEAAGQRLGIIYFAAAIPYFQGVLLYLLSAGFPFFCIFLLVPSRVSAFFVWMSLWLWVKSWDVGFAFINFAREVFWALMPHAGDTREAVNFTQVDWSKPGSIFSVLAQGDPSAQQGTYYTILAILTLSVPAITAHLCLGASNLYGALKNGLDQSANRFAGDRSNMGMRKYSDVLDKDIPMVFGKNQRDAAANAIAKEGWTGDNTARLMSGDGALARHIRGDVAKAEFKAAYDPQLVRMKSELGMYTGRRMPTQEGSGQSSLAGRALDADVNKFREQFEVAPAQSRNPLMLNWTSDKAGNQGSEITKRQEKDNSGEDSLE